MSQDYAGAQRGAMSESLRSEITQLGLDYRVMTQFTSFVAVEDRVVTTDGKPRRVEVPVNLPQGMSAGMGRGAGGGVIGGVLNSASMAAPPPPPPARAIRSFSPPGVVVAQRMAIDPPVDKLDPALRELLHGPHQTSMVEVQILLADGSPATQAALASLGFVASRPAGAGLIVIGHIAIGKLGDLSRLPAVRFNREGCAEALTFRKHQSPGIGHRTPERTLKAFGIAWPAMAPGLP